jgi:hypothetical protein
MELDMKRESAGTTLNDNRCKAIENMSDQGNGTLP